MFSKATLIITKKNRNSLAQDYKFLYQIYKILETGFINIVTVRNKNLKNYLYPFEINYLNDIILRIKIN